MSFRILLRRLTRPPAHSRTRSESVRNAPLPALSVVEQAVRRQPPLLQFPSFRPIPFQHEKFLSIKSRSLESFTKIHGDILQRGTQLRAQLLRRQELSQQQQPNPAGVEATDSGLSPAAQVEYTLESSQYPLTPHQAEELLLLSKKVGDLVDYQGFLLTDELVWRIFHLCVQCGASQLALEEWLKKRIIAENRGPPYPLLVLEDLSSILRTCVLPRLPDSGANLNCSSMLFSVVASSAVSRAPATSMSDSFRTSSALENSVASARHCLLKHLVRQYSAISDEVALGASADVALAHTAHLLADHVWPVWRAMEAMQLTFEPPRKDRAEQEDEEDVSDTERETAEEAVEPQETTEGGDDHWRLPEAAAQTLAVRTALMSVTPLYSFHAHPVSPTPPLGNAEEKSQGPVPAQGNRSGVNTKLFSEPPTFACDVDAILAPLRALLDVWLLLTQCAAEAKDVRLLKELNRFLCLGFLTQTAVVGEESLDHGEGTDDAPRKVVSLNRSAWCEYAFVDSQCVPELARCDHSAEQQAFSAVQEFLHGSLSVVHYGLLCAEQEAALWQLHDLAALVAGAATLLRDFRVSQGTQPNSISGVVRRLDCAFATTAVRSMSAEEAKTALLRAALPAAIESTTSRAREIRGDAEHSRMVGAVRAFLQEEERVFLGNAAPQGAATADTGRLVASPNAEAALYVALTVGDEALLAHAASVMEPPMQEPERALLALNANALRAYRLASSRLQDAEDENSLEPAGPDDHLEAWERPSHLLQRFAAQRERQHARISDEQELRPTQLMESCLQALVLDTAKFYVAHASTYLGTIKRITSATGPVDDSPDVTVDSDERASSELSDYRHGSSDVSEAEEEQLALAEEAWAKLHHDAATCVEGMLERVEETLSDLSEADESMCLTPSALSTLAILARVGVLTASCTVEPVTSPAIEEVEGNTMSVSPVIQSVDRILARVKRDTCNLLRHASSKTATDNEFTGATTAVVGNWVQWVLLGLVDRRAWAGVLEILRALDNTSEDGDSSAQTTALESRASLLCSTTVDPSVFAAIYERALEDGAASVCAFLRPRRQLLFV